MTSPISGTNLSSIDVTELPKHGNVDESKDIAIKEVAAKALESGSSASSNHPIKRARSSLSGLNWIQRTVLRILGMKKESVRKMDELEGQLNKLNKLMQQSAKRAQKQARSSQKNGISLKERDRIQQRSQTTLAAIKEIKEELGSREDVQQLQKENPTLCQGLTQKYDKILLRTELFEFNVKVHEQLNKGKEALVKASKADSTIDKLTGARNTYETAQTQITKELADLLQTMLQSHPKYAQAILQKNNIEIPSGELENGQIKESIKPEHIKGLLKYLSLSLTSYYEEVSTQLSSLEEQRYSSIEKTLNKAESLASQLIEITNGHRNAHGEINVPNKEQMSKYHQIYQEIGSTSIDVGSATWAKEYAERKYGNDIPETIQQQLVEFDVYLKHLIVLKVEGRVFERMEKINQAKGMLNNRGIDDAYKENIKKWIGARAVEMFKAAIWVYQQNKEYQGLKIPSETEQLAFLDKIFTKAFTLLAPAIKTTLSSNEKVLGSDIELHLINKVMQQFTQRVNNSELLPQGEIPEIPSF